ncbi:MAG: SUMF1/EgtB/PvdO family nonheme iron enzyme [Hylemonella sp.]|nr:SUMF1/EgtB/PvdO family nonheme iron enzyme [Hylemonella sp.]
MTEENNGNSAAADDDGDWLGYGAYADVLWSRIESALAKDLIKGDLGDDPLVIGIFGEWGAGKSTLLSLMQKRSKAWAKLRAERRKQDGGNFGLTVPVVFQPWKYEHEEHLHVPMLLHILEALKAQLTEAQTWSEWAADLAPEAIKSHIGAVVKVFGVLAHGASMALDTSLPLASRAGLVGASLLAKALKKSEVKTAAGPAAVLQYADNGRYYYEIQQALKAVTRPKRYPGYMRDVALNADLNIDFVVFIDDLDRCLPEKAVEVLELIKTIFNVESFAFVLALDDEVIERGIGHRYKDYHFEGKKPEMPITGFEYLEKIVHLPFKLPAVSEAQARSFLKNAEASLVSRDKTQRKAARADEIDFWFQPLADQNELARSGRLSPKGKDAALSSTVSIYDLGRLVLKSFDAYVPRKLLRIVELWHTTVQVARERHHADPRKPTLAPDSSSVIDIRIALALQLVQLFQPDLYRVFRRREATFATLFNAFDRSATGLSASQSDLDLWHWAAYRGGIESTGKQRAYPVGAVEALALIAKLGDDQRFPAQQNRLPLVERIIEHRLAQRHVFDVLKLFAELREQVKALPQGFAIGQYFSLLAPFDEPEVQAVVEQSQSLETMTRAEPADPQALYNTLIADDAAIQQTVREVAALPIGTVLSVAAVKVLFQRVQEWIKGAGGKPDQRKARQLLYGLKHLTPCVGREDGKGFWDFVEKAVDLRTETDSHIRALWGDVRAALHCDPRFDLDGLCLAKKNAIDTATAFDTRKDVIPGFAYIDARAKPFWFGDAGEWSGKPVQVPGIQEPFYISRTLTTVAQYHRFVMSANHADHFKGEGQQWLSGEYDSKVTDENLKNWLAKRPPPARIVPFEWEEQQQNLFRPVVNVSCFEAQAYVNWLQQQLRSQWPEIRVALPTELQWECAARFRHSQSPTPRPFPWVEGPGKVDADKMEFAAYSNIAGLVGEVTTVGLYPKGNNPAGLADMAGNVWEWMGHPYVQKFDPMNPIAEQVATGSYSLRGGSWSSLPVFARCSYRYWTLPDDWFNFIGFRVVLSLPISKPAS